MNNLILYPKLPFIFASTSSFNSALTRPNPPADVSERVKGSFYEVLVPFILPTTLRILAWAPCIAEGAIALSKLFPSSTSSKVLSVLLRNGKLPAFSLDRYVIAGTALTMLSSITRIWAIRTLGRHFTHELSIKKDHKLVTDGPYSFVRHPSYTAAALATTGLTILHASPGSFLRVCGWLDSTFGKTVAVVWVMQYILGIWVTISRSKREDEFLRGHFGAEWDKYAERVKYRLIPGLV
ncbi:hypothetical protein BJ138DRAFT_1145622 [Hygrophoropsis aurantiaca]|uniref:Uncharacterized protein n=1 Tax=Hygrophoropsis aurantiaca TaxID=72124 RepID=A0ACB8AK92_9AGAM|nr:hypothetical protein BJ138DRAFT_1145622 [Hygrophoropsis aurantiaca]